MTDLLANIKQLAAGLDERTRKRVELDLIRIESGALEEVAPYLASKSYHRAVVAADANTYEAAGKILEAYLSAAGISVHVTIIKPNGLGDVLADEASLIQLLLDIQQADAELVIAVGGGTLHDIVRYAAYTSRIPFLSVPTAPSVDGFNSKGAPILVRGEKITIAAIGPDAIFADVDILMKAPPALVAAGFGDMLGKYTSLFDWKFGSMTADEPYMQAAADITRSALMRCVQQVDRIAARQEDGIRTLTVALIESGLAMLLFGQSHPASGAEHHLSHYWEMDYIRRGKRQLLHGAKVGVACMEISKLYHRIAVEGLEETRLTMGAAHHEQASRIAANWQDIQHEIRRIPEEAALRELLRQVGGPLSVEELGVDQDLLRRSLQEAHRVRPNRYTLLRANDEWNDRM